MRILREWWDSPEPPEYDEPKELTDTLSVDLDIDTTIKMNSQGIYRFVGNFTNDPNEDSIVYYTDKYSANVGGIDKIEDFLVEFLEDFILDYPDFPEEEGLYHITATVYLGFDVLDIYEYSEYDGFDGYSDNWDSEIDGSDSTLLFDPEESEITNFKIERV